MVKSEIRQIIEQKSLEFKLDPDLIEASVMNESSGNPKATRYEPNFFKTYISPMIRDGKVPVEEGQKLATSWGLMQIMGETAREYGFKGEFEDP